MANQAEEQHRSVTLTKMRTVPNEPNDPIMGITDASASVGVAGAILVFTARYGGGVATHDFHAYWDGSSTRSDPPHITIHLRHDANEDPGKAILTETLRMDVTEVHNELGTFIAVVETAEASSEQVLVKSSH